MVLVLPASDLPYHLEINCLLFLVGQITHPPLGPTPTWLEFRKVWKTSPPETPRCAIDLRGSGLIRTEKIAYDDVWNLATGLVGQCPKFGGSGSVDGNGEWRVGISSPRF